MKNVRYKIGLVNNERMCAYRKIEKACGALATDTCDTRDMDSCSGISSYDSCSIDYVSTDCQSAFSSDVCSYDDCSDLPVSPPGGGGGGSCDGVFGGCDKFG